MRILIALGLSAGLAVAEPPWQVLKDFRSRLRQARKTTNEQYVEAIGRIEDAYFALEGKEPKPEAKWKRSAAVLVAEAVGLARVRGKSKKNERTEVNLRAIRALGRMDEDASVPLRRVFEDRVFRAKYAVAPDLYREGFDVLSGHGQLASFLWFRDVVLTADNREDRIVRTLEALKNMRRFDKVPGRIRLATTKKLLQIFNGITNQTSNGPGRENRGRIDDVARSSAKRHWERIGSEVVETLYMLTRDPIKGDPVRPRGARPAVALKSVRKWLAKNDDPRKAPWVDPR